MIKLIVGKDPKDLGKTQYYLTGLGDYDKFDEVISEVVKHDSSLLSQVDGIYSRTALLDADGKQFKLIHHDDIGVYAFAESDIEDQSWLQDILVKTVEGLNTPE